MTPLSGHGGSPAPPRRGRHTGILAVGVTLVDRPQPPPPLRHDLRQLALQVHGVLEQTPSVEQLEIGSCQQVGGMPERVQRLPGIDSLVSRVAHLNSDRR
ncbi:MAG: hypothetical protein ABR592_00505 [Nitriliruptorales bacterium]